MSVVKKGDRGVGVVDGVRYENYGRILFFSRKRLECPCITVERIWERGNESR